MIQTTEVSITYKGDGVQTSFPYPYPYRNSDDIVGYIINDVGYEKRITNNFKYDKVSNIYQYPLAGDPLAAPYSIKLIRETPQQQNADLPGKLPFSLIEKSLDWIIMILQEIGSRCNSLWHIRNDCKLSETNARNSASAAAESEENIANSENLTKKWAMSSVSPDGVIDTNSPTGYTQSSRSWALYSKEKAQEAATSEAHAKASETKSLASEQNAKDSETNAKTSEIKAATSEVNAKTSETNAKSSETKSKDSENAARVSEQNAAESARVATENAMDFNMLKRNKAYSIGDIAYSSYLPSWARLECVKAGTTAVTVPSSITTVSSGGVLISDGTVLWIVDDVRDMTPVGSVRGSLFLPKGYIKANGATVQRADYPRLVQFINSNNLWTDDTANNVGLFGKGDGSSTFVLPDYRERIPQYTEENIGAKRNAGLPNIIGGVQGLLLADKGEGTFKDAFIYGGIDNPNDGNADGTYGDGDLAGYTTSSNGKLISFKFDAHTSNSIYGSSETVQPPVVNVFPILRY